jgi:hypothetical protein
MHLNINQKKIIWPNGSRKKPLGTKWSSKLKIVVIEENPFIFKLPKPNDKNCSKIDNSYKLCPWSFSKNKQNSVFK